MVLKVWDTGEWGFSEGSIWHSFKKGKRTIWVGKRGGFFIVSIEGERLIRFKTNSKAMLYARAYMRRN